MKLSDFLLKFKSKLNNLEENFIINIFYKDYGEKGLDYITPQYEVQKPDGSGVWKYDFHIKTKIGNYVIETDGLYSHAQGAVTKEYFENLQEKANHTNTLGIKTLRLTNSMIREKPEECIWELRRFFMGDKEMQDIYLNRLGEIKPHEVQQIALKKLEETRKNGKKKGILILATGLGKTYLSAFDVKQFNPRKALFIVHVNEILKQSANSFEDVMPERKNKMGFYNGVQKDKDKDILFASIQTLNRKYHLENFKKNEFDYIVIDETHHSAAPSYRKIFDYFNPKFFLGLTATPERMDRQEILHFYDNNVVFEMDQKEAIKRGYLVPFKYFGFTDDIDYSKIYFNGFKYDLQDLNKALLIEKRDKAVIDRFKAHAIDKKTGEVRKTIGFCVSVEHANWCTKSFREAGFNAISIHSKLDGKDVKFDERDRDKAIAKFRKGEYDIAFVVNMFNEGIDIPDVECLLFLRPTESKSIFIQHMGRGLRISPNKENVLILDFIGNYKSAGLILGGLGLGIKDLNKERKGKKEVYYYDNHGCRVEFDEEVVDIFKKLEANSRKKGDTSAVPEEWKDYGNYLEENTKEGVNLYWKVGNKNNKIPIHLWALELIGDKLGKIPSSKIDEVLRSESRKRFQGNTMEGVRALFFSKLLGLIRNNPMELTEAYNNLRKEKSKTQEIISDQFEKFYFWNDIFSLTNRHVDKTKRKPINEYFHLYPLFFIYESLVILKEKYGYKPFLTKFELETFLNLAREHEDVEEVVERIVRYRENEEKYEIEKYLNEKRRDMDSRIYPTLVCCKYFNWSTSQISIRENIYEEMKKKVEKFKDLLKSKRLIEFRNNPSKYYQMLYSKKDLLSFHQI